MQPQYNNNNNNNNNVLGIEWDNKNNTCLSVNWNLEEWGTNDYLYKSISNEATFKVLILGYILGVY
jgi:hypothetical protein